MEDSIRQSGSAPFDPEGILSREGTNSLFDPQRQADLRLSREGGTEWLPGGIEAAVYQYFQQSAGGAVVRGRVWVDVKTGVPVKLESTPEEAPAPMVESTSVVHFNTSPSEWYPIRIEMTGVARRSIIQRGIETTVFFENYRKYSD